MDRFENIDSVIERFLDDSNIGDKVKKYRIFNHWEEIVGKQIGRKTSPEKFIKDCLYINVENPTWSNELSLMTEQLLEKINSFLKENVVKEIRFKVKH